MSLSEKKIDVYVTKTDNNFLGILQESIAVVSYLLKDEFK